ncbi:GtrA family protein [Comamonas sp. Y33R10-2]|uniref:GtrA family protein n=1 Tax=Comamonas sp. Y33R10-2 TaxID=2853257 RepID=UPI001C5CA601|nr:GtrA family protein [Comamonas sp. Y33R10-2]QXZ09007.1 GtrA family protein [Comamonas sp. Y33R10-2]
MNVLLQRLRSLPQLIQFVLVGGAAAATHLAVVGLLVTFAGLAPLHANVFAFLVAFIVSYNGHALLTFSRAQVHGWAVIGKYFAVACLSFITNELLYYLALHWLHWHYFWSLAGVLVIVAMGTFVMSKFWAFRARSST